MNQSFAQILKEKRTEKGFKLIEVSDALGIDKALVSKIERGDRKATRKQTLAFIEFYDLNEKDTLINWISEKVFQDIKEEKYALEALYVAENLIKQNDNKSKKNFYEPEIQGLLNKVDTLHQQWKDIQINKFILSSEMEEALHMRYIFESNKIEGNTLSLEQTKLVINEGETIPEKSMKEHLEAINLFDALDYIFQKGKDKIELEETFLTELHYQCLKGIDRKNAGKWRNASDKLNTTLQIPQSVLIEKQLIDVFNYYLENKKEVHPVILATNLYEKIFLIFPFKKGNGTISRLVLNYILRQNNFPITIIKSDKKNQSNLLKAFENIQAKKDSSKIHILICHAVILSLQEHIDKVR